MPSDLKFEVIVRKIFIFFKIGFEFKLTRPTDSIELMEYSLKSTFYMLIQLRLKPISNQLKQHMNIFRIGTRLIVILIKLLRYKFKNTHFIKLIIHFRIQNHFYNSYSVLPVHFKHVHFLGQY